MDMLKNNGIGRKHHSMIHITRSDNAIPFHLRKSYEQNRNQLYIFLVINFIQKLICYRKNEKKLLPFALIYIDFINTVKIFIQFTRSFCISVYRILRKGTYMLFHEPIQLNTIFQYRIWIIVFKNKF